MSKTLRLGEIFDQLMVSWLKKLGREFEVSGGALDAVSRMYVVERSVHMWLTKMKVPPGSIHLELRMGTFATKTERVDLGDISNPNIEDNFVRAVKRALAEK